MGRRFGRPVFLALQTLLHGGIADVIAQFPVGQLVEITADAP